MKINKSFLRIIFPLLIFLTTIGLLSQTSNAGNQCSFPVFSNGTTFPSGQSSFSIASGDINNDGKLDAVTVNYHSGNDSLSVFLGDGAGGFEPTRTLVADTFAYFIALSDLNNDGNLDAVVASSQGRITILIGAGNGSFSILTQFAADGPRNLVVSDVNNDGRQDLFVYGGSSSVSVYLGQGNGYFGTPINTPLPSSSTSSALSLADYNQDGNKDFIITKLGMTLWLGDGQGNFTNSGITTPSFGGTIVSGNLNNDNIPDLVIYERDFNFAQPFFGVGNGSFRTGVRYNIGEVSQDLRIADLNNDGLNDIVTANAGSNEISILLGRGNESFSQAINQAVSGEALRLTVGDFNRDNKLDVVTTSRRNSSIMLNLGKGNGTFRAPLNLGIFPSSFTNTVASGDLNNDGKDDLVTGNWEGWGVTVLLRTGDYKFAPPQNYFQSAAMPLVDVKDYNRDGNLDILAADVSTTSRIMLGDGNGNFTVLNSFNVSLRADYQGSADFNNDNKLDLLFTQADSGSLYIFLGNGDGTFASSPITFDNLEGAPMKIAISDLNNDGRLDLTIAVDQGVLGIQGKVQIRLNQGGGNFPTGVSYVIGTSIHPMSVASNDFNNDGKQDFAVVVTTDPTLPWQMKVYLGNGNGTFISNGDYSIQGINAYDLIAKDFNNDGKVDIATINNNSEDFSIFRGNGNGTFTLSQKISSGEQPRKIIAGNFNNDNSLDLVAINYNAGTFTLVPNECNQAPEVTSSTILDFDGDKKTDVAIFRPTTGAWWISRSANSQVYAVGFGASTDKIVPADFTGDGKTDLAFWRESNSFWYILRSEDSTFYGFPFGSAGDIPIAADFDGDGKADQAVFRASNSGWYIQKSSGGIDSVTFGSANDKPVVADYDGDGKADIAITRINNGSREWWGRRSSNGQIFAVTFGDQSDKPVAADYTGDGKADIAFFRPSNGFWYILRSEDNSFYGFPFGTTGDQPTPGDFDGDGKFDASVYRQSNNGWYQQRSTQGFTAITFGASGDVPVHSAFLP